MDPQSVRNFCIIAHIDHGKSTLADRLLELTGALSQREMTAQVLDSMDLERERGITIKAKSVLGAEEVLDAIVRRVPPARGSAEAPLRALIFDSWFDSYRGAVVLVRVMEGRITRHARIRLCSNNEIYEVEELGTLTPKPVVLEELEAGDVGFVVANIKRVADARVGDTLIEADRPAPPLPGFEAIKPMVFAGLYPVLADEYEPLRDALGKLQLNDAAFFYEPENSVALGFGFRCGFLGLLHMEIVQERLEREFGLNLITTAPSVRYRITTTAGESMEVDSPTKFPPPSTMREIAEPVITAMIITSEDSVGAILQLCEEKRGVQKNFEYLSPQRVMLTYELPLNEIVLDSYARLKSVSRGYASLDYQLAGYQESDLVKLDVLVGGEPVDALALIVHREFAYERGRELVTRLRKLIPRQLFEVPIQAAIGSRVIARETVAAMRKNVLAKCYGGDITRKRKLLEKQKEGKKRMKRVGRVDIPQEAFLAVLKVSGTTE